MNIQQTFRWIFASLSIALSVVLGSCSDEQEQYQLPDSRQKEVTFSVQVPSGKSPSTYALNSGDEEQVETIEILLFSGGNYTGSPIYRNSGDITTSVGNNRVKIFTVKIPEGTYDIVVLANSRQAINAVHATIDADANKTKSNVLSQIVQSVSGKWNATPGSGGYQSIPMWGEIPNLTVGSTVPAGQTVDLTRMLAKVDVAISTAAQPKFKLKNVYLYNYHTEGYIVPQTTAWATTPSPVSASRIQGPLVYSTMTTPDVACIGEIYTFEALAGSSANHLTNTCLVVGGRYTGDANDSYYRIDFTKNVGVTTTYLPLLRNHSYTVDIADVEASGMGTPDLAFKSRTVKIQATILPWNDGDMSDVVSDGQYKLGVSAGEFTLTREARTASSPDNILYITTNYPTGWKVDKIVDGSGADIDSSTNPATGWLALDASTGAANATTDRTLLLKENTSGTTRVGFIHLSAGRLTYVVKVTQTTDTALILTITDASNVEITDLIFADDPGVQPAMQTIRLNWIPVSQSVSVSTAAFGGTSGFVYATGGTLTTPGMGSGTSYTDPSGAMALDIRPTAFTPSVGNPFEERISKVDFMVNNGINFLSKSVFFKQLVYSLVVDPLKTSYYLDGSTYTFNVRSNANWKIKSINETLTSGFGSGSLLNLAAGDNLNTNTTGGVNTGAGTPITFTVANRTSLKGTLTIVFESTDSPKRFNDVSVTLNLTDEFYPPTHSGWAGSNIYWDGSKLTFDDMGVTTHQNYQGLYFQWGSLYGISPMNNYSTGTMLYSPDGTASSGLSWTAIPRVASNANIISSPPSDKSSRDRAYLYEITDGATGIGDICKYMTDKGWAPGSATGTKWRMPTGQEHEYGPDYSNWTLIGSTTPSNAGGTNTISGGRTKSGMGTPFFPATGLRFNTDGQLSGVSTHAYYWSASPYGTKTWARSFGTGTIGTTSTFDRALGFSVRCVRE